MFLGVFHLSNPGKDAVNVSVDDVRAPRRQQELQALSEALAKFRPTIIAVERPQADQAHLDELFQAYSDGSRSLSVSEDEQIGMRLARIAGVRGVVGVDSNSTKPPVSEDLYDFEAAAQRFGQSDVLVAVNARNQRRVDVVMDALKRGTIVDALGEANRPDFLAAFRKESLNYLRITKGDETPGANWLQFWYGRNLRIVGRLAALAKPSDRILVIFGFGHVPLLQEFAQQSGFFTVVDPQPFLRDAAERLKHARDKKG
ncbi:hypothetical protein ISN76_09405 [Dyella halodurans]|uniref:DUF5694 domain-containing protein n=1 Tax=Dyella halodurans TaxID=1920171 RepID=A0ABV9C2H1_9GAMM|nr:DUF5694 domain-containing protein [Dyella halodurans]